MPLLTTQEAADFLRRHPVCVRNMARLKQIPALRVGGRWRFEEVTLREWIAQGCPSQQQQPSLFDESQDTPAGEPQKR